MKSRLTCLACGNRTTIQRHGGRLRARGHIKTMWCWRCRGPRRHREG